MPQQRDVTDDLRATVRRELPEVQEIKDPDLRDQVVEAWALCLAHSSFNAIDEIEAAARAGRCPQDIDRRGGR
jgi:hypothetical protein